MIIHLKEGHVFSIEALCNMRKFFYIWLSFASVFGKHLGPNLSAIIQGSKVI
jgi:hypothetical protein